MLLQMRFVAQNFAQKTMYIKMLQYKARQIKT